MTVPENSFHNVKSHFALLSRVTIDDSVKHSGSGSAAWLIFAMKVMPEVLLSSDFIDFIVHGKLYLR